MDSYVAAEIALMDTAKRPQEGAQASPQAFQAVGMHFTDSITVVIARPFVDGVAHAGVGTLQGIVGVGLVGVNWHTRSREGMDMPTQACRSRIGFDTEAHLSGVTPHHADNGRTVILICATSAPFVGPASRRVKDIRMHSPFFPPHSGTSHHFRFPYPAKPLSVASAVPVLVARDANSTASRSRGPTLVTGLSSSRLSESLALAKPLGPDSDGAGRTRCHCISCKSAHSGIGTPSTGFCASGGIRARLRPLPHTSDISARSGGNTAPPMPYFRRDLSGPLLEIPCPILYPIRTLS